MGGVSVDSDIFTVSGTGGLRSGQRRHLIPLSPFQQSSGLLFAQAAPLFEEERNVYGKILIALRIYPKSNY